MADVKNTKEVFELGLAIGRAIASAANDGKWGIMDLMHFLPVITKIAPAVKDIKLIPEEIGELSDQERDELKALLAKDFDISDDELEDKIELAFDVGLRVLQLGADFWLKKK